MATAGANLGNDSKDDVLGGYARAKGAFNIDSHGLERLEWQSLRGQNVLDLAGADSHGERTKSAVGRGVGVATDHSHTGLGQAQLRPYNVDDSLVGIAKRVNANTKLRGVLTKRHDLGARSQICNRLVDIQCWSVVVLGCNGEVGPTNWSAG